MTFQKRVSDIAFTVQPCVNKIVEERGLDNVLDRSDTSSSLLPSHEELRRSIELAKEILRSLGDDI